MKTIIYVLSLVTLCACVIEFSDRPSNFSIELLYYTQQQTEGHVVLSPFGIWTLMTGVAIGAGGNSLQELSKAFVLPKKYNTLINGYKNLTAAVVSAGNSGVTLASKNFVFLDNGFAINPDFRKVIQNEFGAAIKVLDFRDPNSAAKHANSYIQNTGARVANVLRSDDFAESRMILTNVISFKGLWGSPFNKSDTTVAYFYNEKNEVIGEVNMMYQKALFAFSNIEALQGVAIELPYGHENKYAMLIVLPYLNIKIGDMYKNLAKVTIKDIFKQLQKDADEYGVSEVEVKIPRFQISTNVVMNKPLNNMGVYDIFDPSYANFSRVSNETIFVSAIVHKADIEVTESGTVASASTSASFSDRISSPHFYANRPFLYFVMEKSTTSMIFGGIYSKPSKY